MSMSLIATTTIGSNTAAVTLSSIPATYTDLMVRIYAKNDGTGQGNYNITLNGVTATDYSFSYMRAYTTGGPDGNIQTNQSSFLGGWFSGSTNANLYSNTEVYIPAYTSSMYKVIYVSNTSEANSSGTGDWYMGTVAASFRNTSAVSSITFSFTNTAPGSVFYLYGIKNS